MGSEVDKPLSGIAIMEPTFTWALRDTATLSFTEASPRPGSPIASASTTQAQPSISGGQDTDADVYVARAGQPNITHLGNEGMTVLYRESAGTWRGWSGPGFLNGMDQIVETYNSAANYTAFDCVTIPSSQKVIAVIGRLGTTQEPYTRVLDPADWTWDASVDVLADVTGFNYDDAALAVLPNENLICVFQTNDGTTNFWRMYYSTDEAVTWTLGSSSPLPNAATDARLGSQDAGGLTVTSTAMVATSSGDVLLMREGNDGSPFALQFASNSQGARFAQVGTDWTTTPPTKINLLRLNSGALAMAAEVNSAIVFRRVASPFDTIEDIASVQILGNTCDALCAWADPDGMVYVGISQSGEERIYASRDEGASWLEFTSYPLDGRPFATGDGSTKYKPAVATPTMGRVVLLGNSEDANTLGDPTYDGMLWACQLGGWSNVEVQGWHDNGNGTGQTWIPIELPDDIATWTAAGAGSATLTTPGMMRIVTSGAQKYYADTDVGSTTSRDYLFMVDIEVQSGGSVTANDNGLSAAIGDGTNVGTLLLNFTATQYAIYDVTGTAGRGTVTHSVSGRLQVLVYHEYISTTSRKVTTYYKSATAENWTRGHDAVTITTTGAASATSMTWGHTVSGTVTSDWYQMHMAWSAVAGSLAPKFAAADYTGKALNANSYPIPTIGPDTQVARLAMLSGPGLIGESFDIDAVSDYPLSNVYPGVSPSPRAKWKSTSTAENIVMAWDAGQGTQPGQSMVIGGFGCKAPALILEGYRAAAWATITTLDFASGFTGIDYVLEGDVLRADTTGTDASRFIQRNEFAGAWVDLDNGADIRQIRRNTSGEWQAEADNLSAKARIFIDGADGTETANATCTIYAHSGVAIVHNVATDYTKFRVKIQNGNSKFSAWEVGALFVGYVAFAGNQHDWGWQWGRERNSTTRTDRSGTTYTTQEGPAPRTLSISWQGGVDISRHRDSTSLDFRKPTAGDPVAAVDDAAFWQLGIIEEIKSGEVPVIALPYIPDTDTTITDPSLFLYGRITSNAQLDHVVGDEDSAELYRGSSMAFRELI